MGVVGVVVLPCFCSKVVGGGVDVDIRRYISEVLPGAWDSGITFFVLWRRGGSLPQLGEDGPSDPEDDHLSEVAHIRVEEVEDELVFVLEYDYALVGLDLKFEDID